MTEKIEQRQRRKADANAWQDRKARKAGAKEDQFVPMLRYPEDIFREKTVKHVCLANRSLFDTLSEDTQTDGYGIPEPMPLLEIREYLCEVPYCSILADIIAVTGRPKSPMLRLIEPSSSSTGGLQIPQHIITQMNRGRHAYTFTTASKEHW